MSKDASTVPGAETPLSRLDRDDGQPAWQQILKLFARHCVPPPPVQLRDELVNMLTWARYGEAAAHAKLIAPASTAD